MFKPVPPTPAMLGAENRIVCAANRYKDGTVIIGVRHFDMVMHGTLEHFPDLRAEVNPEQGFIDRNFEFQTREAAWEIAFKAEQIIRQVGNGAHGILYSEHLY